MSDLAPGSPVPAFTLPCDDGSEVSSEAMIGTRYVLFFYPKDNTEGCTTEAKDFSEALPAFRAEGVEVIGVSRDSLKRHANFRKKHGLTVKLASDEHSDACEAFGVWVEKSMYGKSFMGIERTTVLVDAQGLVEAVWRKVRVKGHVDAVLHAVKG